MRFFEQKTLKEHDLFDVLKFAIRMYFLLTLFFSQPIVFKYAMTGNKIHHRLLCDNFAVGVDTDTIGIAITVRQEFYHNLVVNFRFDFDCVMPDVGASAAAINMVCRQFRIN